MAKVETCVAKIGKPDLRNGMLTCGMPVTYVCAGEVMNGEPAPYTGWRHVYDGEYDHLGVPESGI